MQAIIVDGDEKEIAALVVALQERRIPSDSESIVREIVHEETNRIAADTR